MPSRRTLLVGAGALAGSLTGCSALQAPHSDDHPDDTLTPASARKIDDWQYEPADLRGGGTGAAAGGGGAGGGSSPAASAPTAVGGGGTYAQGSADGSVGLAAGGAKDANNFRENVEHGHLPLPTDISYEGLFYDYYFNTGATRPCARLFCPAYSTARSPDPLSGESEPYLTVGLESGLSKSDFERKTLNLVVVLDVSGSMGEAFSQYHYDRDGTTASRDSAPETKMAIAREAVADMTTHLREEDRFGMVLFNDSSTVAKPVRPVGRTDMDAIRDHVRTEIEAGGGTRFSAGLGDAIDLLAEYGNADQSQYETRMIVITDAMPNLGDTSEDGLLGRIEANAERDIHTTFVGVGVDFNSRLVDALTAVKGANYYSVHSAEAFQTRLTEEFEYMVTPLVYDLSLELDTPAYEIDQVYGSTAAEEATGELLRVNTLFPSPSQEGKAKGGVVLVKLRRTGEGSSATLSAGWTTRTGKRQTTERTVHVPTDDEQYDNSGIRKAVLLARYADLMKSWTVHERRGDRPRSEGIEEPPEVADSRLGRWERKSHELTISPAYRERFRTFADHFDREMDAVGDNSLQRELSLLHKLASWRETSGPHPVTPTDG